MTHQFLTVLISCLLFLSACALEFNPGEELNKGSITGGTSVPNTVAATFKTTALSNYPDTVFLYNSADLTTPLDFDTVSVTHQFEFTNLDIGTYSIMSSNGSIGFEYHSITITLEHLTHDLGTLTYKNIKNRDVVIQGIDISTVYYFHYVLNQTTEGNYIYPYIEYTDGDTTQFTQLISIKATNNTTATYALTMDGTVLIAIIPTDTTVVNDSLVSSSHYLSSSHMPDSSVSSNDSLSSSSFTQPRSSNDTITVPLSSALIYSSDVHLSSDDSLSSSSTVIPRSSSDTITVPLSSFLILSSTEGLSSSSVLESSALVLSSAISSSSSGPIPLPYDTNDYTLYVHEDFSTSIPLGDSPSESGPLTWTWADDNFPTSPIRGIKENITFSNGTMRLSITDSTIDSSFSVITQAGVATQDFAGGTLRSRYKEFRYGVYEFRKKSTIHSEPSYNGLSLLTGYHDPYTWTEIYAITEMNRSTQAALAFTLINSNDDPSSAAFLDYKAEFNLNEYAMDTLESSWSSADELWHTYTVVWMPDSILWLIDGRVVSSYTPDAPNDYGNTITIPDQPMHCSFQFFFHSFEETPDAPDYPLIVEYDYVKYYRWNGDAAATPTYSVQTIAPL